jgi:hypothetical protein
MDMDIKISSSIISLTTFLVTWMLLMWDTIYELRKTAMMFFVMFFVVMVCGYFLSFLFGDDKPRKRHMNELLK